MSKVWSFSTLSPTSGTPSTIRPGFWSVFVFPNKIKANLLGSKKQGKPVVERVQWFCGIPRQPACRPSALQYKMISREFHNIQLYSHLLVHHCWRGLPH